MTIQAYKLFAEQDNSPLHVGVTEAGTLFSGTIKSAVGIGSILSLGLGDTLRVSLTGEPVEEVKTGWQIVSALDLRRKGPEIISCPTCGRTEINLIDLAQKVENMLQCSKSLVTVAVMGCAVNGPGEAREADYGIAGGTCQGLIFKKGTILKKVNEDILLKEFENILKEDGISEPEGFDLNQFLNTTFHMYNSKHEEVELICLNDLMDAIIDRFGEDVTTYANDMESFRIIVNVAVSHVFYSWVFGFCGKVRIKGPEWVKKEYQDMIKIAYEKEVLK